MDDNEQKINNNVVANTASLWLKNTNEPVRAAYLCQFLGNYTAGRSPPRQFSTVIVASRHRITSYSVLSAHSITSRRLSLSLCLAHPFLSRTLTLSLSHSRFLARAPYSAWLHHNGDQALGPGTAPSLPNPNKTKCIVTQPPKRGSYRAISCFRGRGRNATFPPS